VLKAPSERKAEEKKAEQTGTLHKPVKPAGADRSEEGRQEARTGGHDDHGCRWRQEGRQG
jgi:translation initiation factor IF-2